MTPALIDTDPGVDDALALLYAWSSPDWRVEALTTVAGNVSVEAATLNARRLLALRQPAPPPIVAVGSAGPAGRPVATAAHYHGEDGLGDLDDWPEPPTPRTAPRAVDIILDLARRHGRRLTLVALGPLTNLALAVAANPDAVGGVGRVVAMGGAVDVPGNVTREAEFNFHVDPAAAAHVFAAGLPLHIVPLDATRHVRITREALETALAGRGRIAERVLRFTAKAFARDGEAGMALHDPLAVAAAIDPSLVTWEPVRLSIGHGGETRRAAGAPNCRIATRVVDGDRFVATFLARLCAFS